MSLRRFRKQAEGLDLDKLNRGEVKKRKKKQREQQRAEGSADGAAPAGEEEDDEEEGGDEVTVGGLKQGRGEGSVHASSYSHLQVLPTSVHGIRCLCTRACIWAGPPCQGRGLEVVRRVRTSPKLTPSPILFPVPRLLGTVCLPPLQSR